LNLNLAANGLTAQGKKLGDLTLTASSNQGSVQFALDSNLGGASLHGRGTARLGGDYPVEARLTFQNVAWKGLRPLLSSQAGAPADFDASTDGQITVNGPVLRTADLSGGLELSRLQFTAEPAPASHGQPIEIQNQGPIALLLDHGAVRIQSLHLSGPETDVQANGDVSLAAHTMHASVSAHTDLAIARRLGRGIISSGQVEADATLRGTFEKPLINGKVQLQKASMHFLNLPTGLSDADGLIQFSGNGAVLRNVTASVGGGKVTLAGNLSYSDLLRFQLRLNARNVRLLPQPGISVVIDSDVRLSGRSTASILSGTVSIDQVTYAPQSDLGAILARSIPPVAAEPSPLQLLDNMKLDVQVRTAPGMAVQASVAESLQANANLHVQGTASRPGLLGRVDITEGQLYFFSTNYTVNTGIISFYNPVRIDPILNLSLETQTKGVDVVLHVTGPVDNMKLSYTSDPPLPFHEIIALLATGAVPTSDPNLLANQPSQPPQSFQQMGESALLSNTLTDPIANRLQRVFGITQLKIDPSFAGSSDLPQATIALQQKVTNAVTLTYMTAVDNPSSEVISGEWDFNRQWSATATRDEYGIVSIMLTYKRHLH
jgi:translocation and assembly module TamB